MGGFIRRIIEKIGIDKLLHFFVSAYIVLALALFIHWGIAAAVAILLGVAKELIDGQIDWKDLAADALGVCLSVALCLL